METITNLFNQSWQLLIIAFIAMCLVGFVKIFTKMIKKNADEKFKKIMSKVYIILSLVFSFIGVIIYFLIIKEKLWTFKFTKDVVLVYGAIQALYPIYRNYGGRTLLLKIISLFKGKSKDESVDKVLDIITSVISITDKQLEELKDKLVSNPAEDIKSTENSDDKEISQ